MIECLPKKESQSLLVGYTHRKPRSTTFPLERGGKKPSNQVDFQGLVIEGKKRHHSIFQQDRISVHHVYGIYFKKCRMHRDIFVSLDKHRLNYIECEVMRCGCFVLQINQLKTFSHLKHASNQKCFSLDEEVFLRINRQF